MSANAQWTRTQVARWQGQRFRVIAFAGLMVAALLWPFSPLAQETAHLENHILGIGNCPVWNPQSLEICRHSLEKVVTSLAPRVDAGLDNTHLLVNEGASAAALKRKATELANRLGPSDRLIIYANLPLGKDDTDPATDQSGYVLELWAGQKPETAGQAISEGTWISASAFAAMIHTIPAAEVILILDTNNSHAVNPHLLDRHSVDFKDRPEALVSSSGAGQLANYSADRTISLFAKHLALALLETDGSLFDVITAAVKGTRQAAIPICAGLKETGSEDRPDTSDCNQVPEIQDPDELLSRTMLIPVSETQLN
ncbi:hypothetical protein [Roseibium marinum]|uniref:Uncharacterized protein n=1 Tax=Roseibium marinum TaxID=281252 RepID=A0A2S3UMU4_9HYPH|nr:hypothetical protein [Roseibium marinum]POF29032.1 hypothetical protein CLV41_11036 [Roseibium marinum]